MSKTAKRLVIVGPLLLLSSCSPPDIDISVEKIGAQLHLTLTQDVGLIFRDEQTPCVREVGLHEPNTYGRDHAVWLIEAIGDVQCLDLASVTVGQVPDGWQQVVPLSAVRGLTYTVRAQGIGWGETNVEF